MSPGTPQGPPGPEGINFISSGNFSHRDGFVIRKPGVYVFKEDLTLNPSKNCVPGILIDADNVVLDLSDFTLFQDLSSTTVNNAGIFIRAHKNVTVQNGHIKGFSSIGIWVDAGTQNLLIDDMDIGDMVIRYDSTLASPNMTSPCFHAMQDGFAGGTYFAGGIVLGGLVPNLPGVFAGQPDIAVVDTRIRGCSITNISATNGPFTFLGGQVYVSAIVGAGIDRIQVTKNTITTISSLNLTARGISFSSVNHAVIGSNYVADITHATGSSGITCSPGTHCDIVDNRVIGVVQNPPSPGQVGRGTAGIGATSGNYILVARNYIAGIGVNIGTVGAPPTLNADVVDSVGVSLRGSNNSVAENNVVEDMFITGGGFTAAYLSVGDPAISSSGLVTPGGFNNVFRNNKAVGMVATPATGITPIPPAEGYGFYIDTIPPAAGVPFSVPSCIVIEDNVVENANTNGLYCNNAQMCTAKRNTIQCDGVTGILVANTIVAAGSTQGNIFERNQVYNHSGIGINDTTFTLGSVSPNIYFGNNAAKNQASNYSANIDAPASGIQVIHWVQSTGMQPPPNITRASNLSID